MDGLALTDGFTGAIGITLFAPDEARSEPEGLRFWVRSMDGNCMMTRVFGPLWLLFYVDVHFLTADLGGYLGLFLNKFEKDGDAQGFRHVCTKVVHQSQPPKPRDGIKIAYSSMGFPGCLPQSGSALSLASSRMRGIFSDSCQLL
jgi:hypothetical protein